MKQGLLGEDDQNAPQYERVNSCDDETGQESDNLSDDATPVEPQEDAKHIKQSFRWMSILFAANHASVVSCMSLATARFAAVGAWQNGILYMSYVASALFGATWVVKRMGGRDALLCGMGLYGVYVAAFLAATLNPQNERLFAYIGAGIGGVGAGFLWTAQGAYFASAAEKHSTALGQPLEQSTNEFGSMFAFYYLGEEVILRAISSLAGSTKYISWAVIFAIYVLVAVGATVGMAGVEKFEQSPSSNPSERQQDSWLHRSTAALQLLRDDSKMKYMIGLNAVFGFSAAFLGAYVNGEVVDNVFKTPNMVGILTAWLSIVAAFMSVVFERIAQAYSKGLVLIIGSICFAWVAIPFVLFPTTQSWTPLFLVLVYTMQGTGRATFESTLKAVFADFFHFEKEGAFANIILQNGTASAIGFALSFGLECKKETGYCVRFRGDGHLHDMLTFESLVIGTSIIAILGYLRADLLHRQGRFASGRELVPEESAVV